MNRSIIITLASIASVIIIIGAIIAGFIVIDRLTSNSSDPDELFIHDLTIALSNNSGDTTDKITNKNADLTITGTTVSSGVVDVYENDVFIISCNANEKGTFNCIIPNKLADGDHTFQFSIEDPSLTPSTAVKNIVITIDTQPPVISGWEMTSGDNLVLTLSESCDRATIENTANYDLPARTEIIDIVYDSQTDLAQVSFAQAIDGNYSVAITGFKDIAGNTIDQVSFNIVWSSYYSNLEMVFGSVFVDNLATLISDATLIGYDEARDLLFSRISNVNGYVTCVYTGRRAYIDPGKDPTDTAFEHDINTEHTWPTSLMAGQSGARSDLHHLFPTDADANNRRGNLPFGNVIDTYWEGADNDSDGSISKRGLAANGTEVFEPQDSHKGDCARAFMYFSIRYGMTIDPELELVLRQWHALDPPDNTEEEKHSRVITYQNNHNPFIDNPQWVDRIADF